MKMKVWGSLLPLVACVCTLVAHADPNLPSAPPAASSDATLAPEPSWGRFYLRRGLAPIQYFRDRYGGPMVAREVEFYFPRRVDDRLGCALLPADEQAAIRAANGTIALIVDRGVCTFETKSRLAQAMGVAALIVVNEDDSVTAPVATVDNGEITIATVMVRKSAGDMMRRVALRERLFGRLIPLVCERKPYVCKARTAAENQYMDEQSARSGVVVAQATNTTLGYFLAASYGPILPTGPLQIPRDAAPIDGCGELDPNLLSGKVALFSAAGAAGDGCTILDKVSLAQRAGAVAALLTLGDSTVTIKHPAVTQSWHAYNITIAAATVTNATLDKLVQMQQQYLEAEAGGREIEVQLDVRNRIADAWDQVRRLSVKTGWPSRKDRQVKLLQRILGDFELDDSQLLELKQNYLTIAGGSGTAWDHAVTPPVHDGKADEVNNADRAQHTEIAVEAVGM